MMSLEENDCKDKPIEFREKEELDYSMGNQEDILLRIQEIEILNCPLAQVLVPGCR